MGVLTAPSPGPKKNENRFQILKVSRSLSLELSDQRQDFELSQLKKSAHPSATAG
jgi:hypothetical protein